MGVKKEASRRGYSACRLITNEASDTNTMRGRRDGLAWWWSSGFAIKPQSGTINWQLEGASEFKLRYSKERQAIGIRTNQWCQEV